MTYEERILERLDRIEERLRPITDSGEAVRDLRQDLAPRLNEAVQYLITELADIEADFQIEDLIYLCKKVLRNIDHFNFSIDMLKNAIDFAVTAEPLLKSSVPIAIQYLDELEQSHVFKIMDVSIRMAKKIGDTYTVEEIEQMADGVVRLAGLLKDLTHPVSLDLLERAARLPSAVDLDQAQTAGPVSMVKALGDEQVRQGVGVLLELTRGLSALKT